jgi:hypothetical protein
MKPCLEIEYRYRDGEDVMDPEQFRKDKAIDPNQLDVECVQLAERAYHWARASVEADIGEDRAKFKLAMVESKLETECRMSPTSFGLTKLTDASVKSAVRIHPELVQAYDVWLEARKRSKLLMAAVRAMTDKKHMLQGLITLHGQQYFAGPSVPRDLIADWREHLEKTEQQVNELQRQRTRRRKT